MFDRPVFPIEERERLLKKITFDKEDIEIVRIDGLVADYVKDNDIDLIVEIIFL
jgi:phosphopantetheine adenylyltransferase